MLQFKQKFNVKSPYFYKLCFLLKVTGGQRETGNTHRPPSKT